ncbi:MAG: hypothetical protein AAGF47_04005 [Planctomycetota bacterium]
MAWSAATVVLLAGCSGLPRSARAPAPDAQNPTAAADTPDNSLEALIAQQAFDLERMAAGELGPASSDTPSTAIGSRNQPPGLSIEPPTRRRPAAGRTDEPTTPAADDALLRALSLAGGGTGALSRPAESAAESPIADRPEPAAADAIDRTTEIARLTNRLAALLKEESLEGDDPARPLVPAALLAAIAGGTIDEADLPGGGPLMLTESERAALLALRKLAVRAVGTGDEPAGDPHRLREILLETAESLREQARVRIAAAELATRAPGFGSYVPVPRRSFLAGRTNRVVVYAEVEHFQLRPATRAEAATEGDTVAADLTQELELYLRAGDPQPTWKRTIDWMPRTSRRAFDDLFVATAIELPGTLSVGEYDLRVRITDEVSGAQDEAVIPIRLVADGSALDDEPRQARVEGPKNPPVSGNLLPSFTAPRDGTLPESAGR